MRLEYGLYQWRHRINNFEICSCLLLKPLEMQRGFGELRCCFFNGLFQSPSVRRCCRMQIWCNEKTCHRFSLLAVLAKCRPNEVVKLFLRTDNWNTIAYLWRKSCCLPNNRPHGNNEHGSSLSHVLQMDSWQSENWVNSWGQWKRGIVIFCRL